MRITEDIKPVTYVKSRAAELLSRLSENRRPVVITQNGEPRGVLPASQEEIDSLFDLEPAALYDIANKKLSRTRIVVRTGIVDTAEMTHLLERIDAFASPKLLHRALGKRNMFPNGFLVRSMGTSVRLYESAERLRREAWRGLGRVAAALAAIIALFFLSLRIAAVSVSSTGM